MIMHKKTTIREIADKLNVAPSTVSRALGNDPGVSEKRRQEIHKLAEKMYYKPQPLRRKKTNTIGLILTTNLAGTTDKEFLKVVTFYAERAAAERNVHVHLAFTDTGDGKEGTALPAIVEEGRVDGVIVAGYPPESLCDKLRKTQIPAVVLHDRATRTNLNTVFLNSEPALREAMGRMIKAGCKDIALALTNPLYPGMESLLRGYKIGLAENDIEYQDNLVVDGLTDSFAGGLDLVNRLMARKKLPDAIVFGNDWMAFGGMYLLAQRGIKVPDDISILGHDNTLLSMEIIPHLTTIDSFLNPSVPRAFDLLQRQIDGELSEITEVVLEAPLRWRESCKG